MIPIGRMLAICAVFLLGAAGWMILGNASEDRSLATHYALGQSVASLWGQPLTQLPPAITTRSPGATARTTVAPSHAEVRARLDVKHRRKGLLWFATYKVAFEGQYEITNPGPVRQRYQVAFTLPDPQATYVGVQVRVDGEVKVARPRADGTVLVDITVPAQGKRVTGFRYQTRGLDAWRYRPGSGRVALPSLDVAVTTNFADVDFPVGGLSPMSNELRDDDDGVPLGRQLVWRATDLLTSRDIAVDMPQRLNPGPVAARMSYFAPVGLLFFFVALAGIAVVRRLEIHPVHYLFVTAGFFAFHLLFAYLVDVVSLYGAFALAAAVSLGLVCAYLRGALGVGFPLAAGGLAQAVYLVLFSWSFFLPGATGLTVTIGAVMTLAVLMALTARTDWRRVFSAPSRAEQDAKGTESSEPLLELDAQLPDGA